MGLAWLLAGCVLPDELVFDSQAKFEETTPYTQLAPSQAWINPPGMTFVMARGLLNSIEQRVGLPNDVPVPGDNLVVLRARVGAGGNLQFEEFMRRTGGAPMPFQSIGSGDLRSGEDSLGTYLWAEQTFGTDITCVFGLRRLTGAMRELPAEATVMDVMLRNCLRGTAQQALAPMLDASIGVEALAGTGQGSTRMMSPLAAPGLE